MVEKEWQSSSSGTLGKLSRTGRRRSHRSISTDSVLLPAPPPAPLPVHCLSGSGLVQCRAAAQTRIPSFASPARLPCRLLYGSRRWGTDPIARVSRVPAPTSTSRWPSSISSPTARPTTMPPRSPRHWLAPAWYVPAARRHGATALCYSRVTSARPRSPVQCRAPQLLGPLAGLVGISSPPPMHCHSPHVSSLGLHLIQVRGDRVLLAFEPGVDFIATLIGCMAAGVIGVPVQIPGEVAPSLLCCSWRHIPMTHMPPLSPHPCHTPLRSLRSLRAKHVPRLPPPLSSSLSSLLWVMHMWLSNGQKS